MTEAEFKGRLRLSGYEVDGNYDMIKALRMVKGIGQRLAEAIAGEFEKTEGVKKSTKIGYLSDEQLEKLEKIIASPGEFGIPTWMLNRRKDFESGRDIHLVGSDLEFAIQNDKKREMNMRSYRGVRHMFGLPVRGQRTRTMGRTGVTVGVQRKKQQPAKKKK